MRFLLGHQSGWDEVLWFVVPIVIVLFGLRWAQQRARSRETDNMPGDMDA